MKSKWMIVFSLLLTQTPTLANAMEACEKEANLFASLIAKSSGGTLVQKPTLIWFSETVSYHFKIVDLFHELKYYTVKYSILLKPESDDLGEPDACRLMLSGETDLEGNYLWVNY